MYKFKITYRCDDMPYFCTDSYNVKAVSLLEAAQKADEEIEKRLKGTIWRIERID